MTADRTFCRFNLQAETAAFSVTKILKDSRCMSAFLMVTEVGHPTGPPWGA